MNTKKIVAIAVTAAVLLGAALGLVSFKGSTKISVSTDVTTEADKTTTNTDVAETTFSIGAGLSTETTESTASAGNH